MHPQHDGELAKFEERMIGIWQAGFPMASGWLDAYQFFPDRKYRFDDNQMDCAKNKIWEAGTWRVHNGVLELARAKVMVMEGGKFEVEKLGASKRVCLRKATGRTLEAPRAYKFPISKITQVDASAPLTLEIQSRKFFKMEENPANW